MTPHLGANIASYSCQVGLLAFVAWAAAALSRIQSPRLLLAHYQTAILMSLALPLLAVRPVQPGAQNLLFRVAAFGTVSGEQSSGSPIAATVVVFILIAGAGARLCWLALGCARLRSLRRNARLLDPPPETVRQLEHLLGVRARWCISEAVEGAATYGLWRPVVLLPARMVDESESPLRLVACHELVHVRRRDWVFTVAEEVVRAALWFHPGIWLLLDRVRLHREQVVDERVIAITSDRQGYAEALLDVAGLEWSLQPTPASTWLRARHLRARILQIVNGGSMSRARLVASALAMVFVLGASGLWAASAFPVQNTPRVYDAKEAGVTLPRIIREVKPAYTPEAMKEKIQGSMALTMIVQSDGTPGDVVVTRSLDQTYGLDEQGVKATKQWRFRPGTKDGKPVPVRIAIELTFTLK